MRQHTADTGTEIHEGEAFISYGGGEQQFHCLPYLAAGKIERHLRAERAPVHHQQNQESDKEEVRRQLQRQHQHQCGDEQELDEQPPARQTCDAAECGGKRAAQQGEQQRGQLDYRGAGEQQRNSERSSLQQQRDDRGRQLGDQDAQFNVATLLPLPAVWCGPPVVPPIAMRNPLPYPARAK